MQEGSSTSVHPLSSLELRPEGFRELLESEYDLVLLREFSPQHEHQGFSRPVMVFKSQLASTAWQHRECVYPEGELSPVR